MLGYYELFEYFGIITEIFDDINKSLDKIQKGFRKRKVYVLAKGYFFAKEEEERSGCKRKIT